MAGSRRPERSATAAAKPGEPGAVAGDELPVLSFASAAAWERWLARNHERSQGVWIAIAKQGSAIKSVRYPHVLELAICFGWIDGRRRALDEHRFLQRSTPRRPRGRWSRLNRELAERMIEAGAMRPAGLVEVQRARADGRWSSAYEPQSAATVPPDLQAALDASAAAASAFAALSSQNRYAILYRLGEAKRAQTRARRLAKFVTMLQDGETIHPQ
jgi:uncharacterized protein YdeI (YjbR/CyaY-like superfamily)